MTSPLNFRASSTASALLPDEVGPTIMRTFGFIAAHSTMEWMEKKITVYYDGMCRGGSVAADALSAEPGKMYFVDANKTELPAGITFQDAMHDVYAVDVSGRRYKGDEAVLKILEQ